MKYLFVTITLLVLISHIAEAQSRYSDRAGKDKYPKATFKGKIKDLSKLDLTKDGKYSVEVEGEITLHGETQPLKTTVDFVVKDKTISASSTFSLRVKDFKITIPTVVVKNIAEVVEVKVSFNYKPA
jgi:polyisoprenoid-binding protein YceI